MENQKIDIETAAEAIGSSLFIGAYKDTEVILKEISGELVNVNEITSGQTFVEMLHFYLNLTDRYAFQYLEDSQRSALFDKIVDIVLKNHLEGCYKYGEIKIHPDIFCRIFNETHKKRQIEYGGYRKKEMGQKGNLFYEFVSRMAEILGAKNNSLVIMSIHTIFIPFVEKYHKFCKVIMSEIK